jgi:hypothetical protein
LLGARRPQRQLQFRDQRVPRAKPGNRETQDSQETTVKLEIEGGRDIPEMRAGLAIQARRDDPATRVVKAEKVGTRHVQLANIATRTPKLGKLVASETNNLNV